MTFPPAGACDCHTHVIGPKTIYPLTAKRSYTPVDAPIDALDAMLKRCGMDRVVLVQTSIFGTDNRCTLDGLAHLGLSRARAVTVPDENITNAEIDRWHELGVRGVRLNLASAGRTGRDDIIDGIRRLMPVCERHGWHVQFLLPADAYAGLETELTGLPAEVVFDHFAFIRPHETSSETTSAILRMLESGRCWIKLSGTYRLAPDRRDPALGDLARKMAAINPERLVFATDWPHPPKHNASNDATDEETPYREMDTPDLVHDLSRWFDDPDLVKRILVDNPAHLYDFD
jgi:predicted TIM-barrel fold metal-dependent hydrolase